MECGAAEGVCILLGARLPVPLAPTAEGTVSERWKIVEGSHWIPNLGSNEQEARTAFEIIRKHGFQFICFVGRPNASMTYFRRA